MKTRRGLSALITLVAIVAGAIGVSVNELDAANPRVSVQVRVMCIPRVGPVQFLPNYRVRVMKDGRNFAEGVTGTHPNHALNYRVEGPATRYTAQAYIGGRWVNPKTIDEKFQGAGRRIDFVVD